MIFKTNNKMLRILFFTLPFLHASITQGEPIHYSTELKPHFSESYYIEQGLKYFDSLDSFSPRDSRPTYSSHVIRWEWYPWLFLTGHRKRWMKLDRFLLLYPTEVIHRDCRNFAVQPFVRCRVTFHYLRNDTHYPIYEEFTFNDLGEITFVEAWSDEDGRLPMDPKKDYWAEGKDVKRISTKIPGLGNPNGRYDWQQLSEIAKNPNGDPDLKNLFNRLRFPIFRWIMEAIRYSKNSKEHTIKPNP